MTPKPSPSPDDTAIVVVLPVYNGAKFLGQQLDSILAQSFTNTVVLCRDDGSSDASAEVMRQYAQAHPEQIVVLHDARGNVGARENFSLLMQAALDFDNAALRRASRRYCALADQDDLWLPHKLETLLTRMTELEAAHPGRPTIVHSDVRVVAEDGSVIAPSMAAYQGLRPERDSFAAQLISNTVTGCTVLMNRALLEKGTPIPAESIMHDWWMSLIASAFGQRAYLRQSLVDYRQHATNTIGAKEWVKPTRHRNIFTHLMDDSHSQTFQNNARQARAFSARHGHELGLYQKFVLLLATQLAIPFPPLQRVLYRLLRQL
ncbi:glycosyltransferase family 2 protein [Hydrogenophaga aromaticivorans]|uniref:glycosyltransferase family 2 protein n=1 Tax=Hydrogenophaga aromaticivorans TaxID=2610898 RepID=UPI001B3645A1|nr:glycosyltransferase family 2 protein [Hydrogenophaga aromaticivorans]MBQ0918456.1 glycosyltransferase family 2 protein [Hydrogenophaga aromaticivorans]